MILAFTAGAFVGMAITGVMMIVMDRLLSGRYL